MSRTRSDKKITGFTYKNKREDKNLRLSFCEVAYEDTSLEVFYKEKSLGEGAFGACWLMKSLTGGFVVVKDFKIDMLYDKKVNIENQVKKNDERCKHEVKFNNLLNGFAYYYQNNESLTVQSYVSENEVLTFPHSYLLMPYFPGEILGNVTIKNSQHFFSLMIAVLNKVKTWHDKNVVHSDIKANNIIINENSQGIIAELIDTTFTHVHGDPIFIDDEYLNVGIPELRFAFEQNFKTIRANKNQDIYLLGLMFSTLLKKNKNLFDSHVFNKLLALCDTMMSAMPSKRPNIDTLIASAKLIKNSDLPALIDSKIQTLENNLDSDANLFAWLKYSTLKIELSAAKDSASLDALRANFNDGNYFADNKNVHKAIATQFLNGNLSKHQIPIAKILLLSHSTEEQFKKIIAEYIGEKLYNTIIYNDILNNNCFFKFEDYDKLVTDKFGREAADIVLQNTIQHYYDKNNHSFKKFLKVMDKEKFSPEFYQRFLSMCNTVYSENRNKHSKKYYTIFGLFSRTDKVKASHSVGVKFQRGQMTNLSVAARTGELGEIVNRMVKFTKRR